MGKRLVVIILLLCYYSNAYSRSNENETLKKKLSLNNEPEFNVRHLNKPFKINKLNLVWSKAKQVSFLTTIMCARSFDFLEKSFFCFFFRDVRNQS